MAPSPTISSSLILRGTKTLITTKTADVATTFDHEAGARELLQDLDTAWCASVERLVRVADGKEHDAEVGVGEEAGEDTA